MNGCPWLQQLRVAPGEMSRLRMVWRPGKAWFKDKVVTNHSASWISGFILICSLKGKVIKTNQPRIVRDDHT
jgi:hypothetical protein